MAVGVKSGNRPFVNTIRVMRVKHLCGDATTDPLRGSCHPVCFLQAALRLRLRLHGVNDNRPSPTAVGEAFPPAPLKKAPGFLSSVLFERYAILFFYLLL